MYWSQEASCNSSSDLTRRQCEAVRKARAAAVQGKTFLMTGGEGTVEAGRFNGKAKTVGLQIKSCVACGEDVDTVVVGGRAKMAKGHVQAPLSTRASHSVADKAAAEHFSKYVVPRVRTDFLLHLVRIRPRAGWATGTRFASRWLDIGFTIPAPALSLRRLWRPRQRQPIPRAAATGLREPKVVETKPEAPRGPKLPDQWRLPPRSTTLSREPAKRAQACFKAYQIEGTANFRITIKGDGTVCSRRQW